MASTAIPACQINIAFTFLRQNCAYLIDICLGFTHLLWHISREKRRDGLFSANQLFSILLNASYIDYSLNHFCHSSTLLLWMDNMKADQPTGSRNGMILGIQYLSAASLCQVTTELTPLSLCKVGRSRALTTSLIYYFAYFSVELRNKQYKLFREK